MLTFENQFKISMFALRFNGAHPNLIHDKKWMAKFTFIVALSAGFFVLLLNSIISHDIRNGRYTEAIKNGTLATVHLLICLNNYVLLQHANSIRRYIKFIDEDYAGFEQHTSEEKAIILRYSEKGTNICVYWFISSFSTGAMFPLKALCFMAISLYRGEFKLIPMYDMVYPEPIESHKNTPYVFLTLFFFCFIFDVYATSVYVGIGPLAYIFLLHVCGQIEILILRMKKVMSEITDLSEIRANLRKTNQRLQVLYSFHNSLQSNFVELLEFNMKTTIFLLPFSAFEIVQSLQHLELNMEFTCFFLGFIIQFFIPSYYSNLLMDKSNELREAIYSCGWENQPNIQIRKTVLFMLVRCGIPLSMRTIFHPVNLATFAVVCRQAYAIFNIMNAALS